MLEEFEKTISIIEKYQEAIEALEADGSPQWLVDLRRQSLSRFTELGFPKIKDEDWKYTNIAPIVKRSYQMSTSAGTLSAHDKKAFAQYCNSCEHNIVFVDGVFSKELSNINQLSDGVGVQRFQETINDINSSITSWLTQKYDVKEDSSFTALNTTFMRDCIFIHVDSGIAASEFIHIIYVTTSSDIIVFPRTLIVLDEGSEATVLESHLGFNDEITYFTNAVTDIFLAHNAALHYCQAQNEGAKAFHIGNTRVWQEAHSRFDGFSLTSGGAITRNELDVVLDGEGTEVALNGLYSVSGNQHVDNHTSIDHRWAHGTSRQVYKGILSGASRAVFNGKIFVRPVAQKTNSFQLNKNLLLGKECHVDTKPQLEIFADDVKCSHGATVGQLNKDEIFYLRSRGIPERQAVAMLAHGFVDDLLEMVKNEAVRQKLHQWCQICANHWGLCG